MIEHVKFGWKALEEVINRLIDEVNRNRPEGLGGITTSPQSTGTTIALGLPTSDSSGWRVTPGDHSRSIDPEVAGWTEVYCLTKSGSEIVSTSHLWVWAGRPRPPESPVSMGGGGGETPWKYLPENEDGTGVSTTLAGWVQHDVCVGTAVVKKWFWGEKT